MPLHVPNHLKDRFDAIERLPTQLSLPAPWKDAAEFAVGGLTDVGFGDSSDLLLCISSNGRGVFDCRAGARVARDASTTFEFDTGNLQVDGIGPLAGMKIRIAGIRGGGLACCTSDGWDVQQHPYAFPEEELIVGPPGQSLYSLQRGEPMRLIKLGGWVTELKAYGFSPTGKSFIVATSSEIFVFARD